MFPFEVLPVHPPPFPLESLTGYLVRLAEVNGLTTKSGLTAIAFPQLRWKMNWSDYPCPSFGNLPQVTLCSVSQLQNTTFYPLLQKFGRALSPVHCSRFLADSISPYLRYCPLCLADHGFYSLVWRFQTVMGCPEHGVRLLEHCQHCGHHIPLVSTSLRVGICPACGQDVRTCQAPPLTPEEHIHTRDRFDDLAYLLTPQAWDESDEVRRAFGSYLLQLRLGHRWSKQDVTAQLGIGLHVLRGLEGYRKTGRGETFTHYLQYLDLLQVSFRDIFTAVQNPTARHELRLHQVVQTVQQAIAELESRQQVVTQEKICQFLDTYPHLLRQYPEVCAILDQVTVTRKNQYRRLMVTRVQAAIDQLLDTQRVPCANAVCELLGISGPTLSQYPEAYILLTPYANPPQWERENSLIPQVEQAIAALNAPFQEDIAEQVGMRLYPLRRYPRIRLRLNQFPRREKKRQAHPS